MSSKPTLIVGAGLAGLACARKLHLAGLPFALYEASDDVGGRIRTDVVDGFLLDRGFQVLLDAYPEAQAQFDMDALALHRFFPGALCRHEGAFHRLADPFRKPVQAVAGLFSGPGSFGDKLKILGLRGRSRKQLDAIAGSERTTAAQLEEDGFSGAMTEAFLRPWLAGIFLEKELTTTNRMLAFVFGMFAKGHACLPAEGMQALPRQLAADLPQDAIHLDTRVAAVTPTSITLEDGTTVEAASVVVATEGPAAKRLLGEAAEKPEGRAVTCVYFDAPEDPVGGPLLVLNGEGDGIVNNLCVPSAVAPSYAPPGRHLISASVLGTPAMDDNELEAAVRAHLTTWYGDAVGRWRYLDTKRVPFALPVRDVGSLDDDQRRVVRDDGLYVCGDHRETASIQGALVSGRRAAEAILATQPAPRSVG